MKFFGHILSWYSVESNETDGDVCFCFYSSDGKRQVLPLCPPEDCKPGDRVVVKGYEHETAGGESWWESTTPILIFSQLLLFLVK